MKYSFYLLVIFLFGVFGCDDSDSIPTPYVVSADLNGANWEGKAQIMLDADSDMTFHAMRNEEVLAATLKFNGLGACQLEADRTGYYTTVGYDVVTSSYVLDTNSIAKFSITAIDTVRNLMEGTFEASFLKTDGNPEEAITRIQFTNGKFKGGFLRVEDIH